MQFSRVLSFCRHFNSSFNNQRFYARIMSTSQVSKKANRLINEKSPYLLQHAYNPVDWFPWGDEAFEKARKDGKLIFLSVGYSTCHWCHVMERESFENESVAKIMNEFYVNIKVDREERPDIDKVYMTFVQATSGGGGWPMSVWLTPQLKPVLGGTYFPPDDQHLLTAGRPGFKTILRHLHEQWVKNRSELEEQGSKIIELLQQATMAPSTAGSGNTPNVDAKRAFRAGYERLERKFDDIRGGFGGAPKFPQCSNFELLLAIHVVNGLSEYPKALSMTLDTLRHMARGGIHDHVGKGFHRYSTDAKWHVPHFEKMLYDQAQLSAVYAKAFAITSDSFYKDVAEDILEYVRRDLMHEGSGGFYSAEDADSYPTHEATEKVEGAFCVWKKDTVRHLWQEAETGGNTSPGSFNVDKRVDLFCSYYGIDDNGNVDPHQDPHGELLGQNVLYVRRTVANMASTYAIPESEVEQYLGEGRAILWAERQLKRPKPHRDEKFVAAWNALMISGFALCGRLFNDKKYLEIAERAFNFVRMHLVQKDGSGERLLRSAYHDPESDTVVQIATPIRGVADDYAFWVRACLDMFEATLDTQYIAYAQQWQRRQDDLFWDSESAAYFQSEPDPNVVIRLKDDQDGAEPSANSVAMDNLFRLYAILHDESIKEKAWKLASHFSGYLTQHPYAVPAMLAALVRGSNPEKRVIIVGNPADQQTADVIRHCTSRWNPILTVLLKDTLKTASATDIVGVALDAYGSLEGKNVTVFVCQDMSCQAPVHDLESVKKLLYSN